MILLMKILEKGHHTYKPEMRNEPCGGSVTAWKVKPLCEVEFSDEADAKALLEQFEAALGTTARGKQNG